MLKGISWMLSSRRVAVTTIVPVPFLPNPFERDSAASGMERRRVKKMNSKGQWTLMKATFHSSEDANVIVAVGPLPLACMSSERRQRR